jgi:F-type H+-transporting ATPase subunit c
MKRILTLLALAVTTLYALPLLADQAQEVANAGGGMSSGLIALAAGLAIGIAAFGGALGQGRAVASALEGIARNPEARIMGPLIVGLALIESLVIYALLIAFFLQGKVS